MTEKVFERPPLFEEPQEWRRFWLFRPNRGQVLGTFDQVFDRFIVRGQELDQRYQSGEQLSDQELITLVDAKAASAGRRNLNVSDVFAKIRQLEARGRSLTPNQEEMKERYQRGEFQLIPDTNQPFDDDILVDRFTYPVEDDHQSFAIKDGAPVEGMISFLDQEIQEVRNRRIGFLPIAKIRQLWELRNLRSQRNLLSTASSQVFSTEDSVFHARTQLEAYLDYLDPIRTGGQLPDWFNAERFLRERRVLNIPKRTRENWLIGAIPLGLLPIPFIIWALQPTPAPVIQEVNHDPCKDTGGKLYLEVFNAVNPDEISIKGAIEREMAYLRLGISQREYRPADDPEMVAEVERLKVEEPEYYETYLKVAMEDYEQTAVRLLVDGEERPWIDGSDFKPRGLLGSCLTPEMRDVKVRQILTKS